MVFIAAALGLAAHARAQSGPVREYIYLGDRLLAQETNWEDVPASHPDYQWINTIVARGVTAGCGGARYCPDQAVNRDVMAMYLLKSREGSGYTPPACTTQVFGDVPCTQPYAAWINELQRRNVFSGFNDAGCGPGNYCPGVATTNDIMAVALLRTKEQVAGGPIYNPPACAVPAFSDVPCSSVFAPWVNELASRGITAGCGSGLYCPAAAVTRGSMARLLVKTFNL